MKKYIFVDNAWFNVKDSTDLAMQMWKSSFIGASYKTLNGYLRGFSRRAQNLLGVKLDISSSDTFVRDLIKHGLLKEAKLN